MTIKMRPPSTTASSISGERTDPKKVGAEVEEWASLAESGKSLNELRSEKAQPWEGFDPHAKRTPTANPNAKGLTINLNEYEFYRLVEAARRANRSKSSFIIDATLKAINEQLDGQ
jgi:hypothetical protein